MSKIFLAHYNVLSAHLPQLKPDDHPFKGKGPSVSASELEQLNVSSPATLARKRNKPDVKLLLDVQDENVQLGIIHCARDRCQPTGPSAFGIWPLTDA